MAPELSAICNTLSVWTILVHPILELLGGLALDGLHRPAFILGNRPSLDNFHDVTDVTAVLFIVRLEVLSSANVLPVLRMLHEAFDTNDDGFIHLVRNDHAGAMFSMLIHS